MQRLRDLLWSDPGQERDLTRGSEPPHFTSPGLLGAPWALQQQQQGSPL